MKNWKKLSSRIATLTATTMCAVTLFAASGPQVLPPWGNHFLVTNDDAIVNTATFYGIRTNGTIKQKLVVPTGGTGLGTGYYATGRVGIMQGKFNKCVFISDGGSSDIASILVNTLTVAGNFKGSSTDSGNAEGIGLARSGRYLYASFTGSNTIGTFKIMAGCQLSFIGDVSTQGLNGGIVDGMAANGKILVVAYADGSIQSFNIAKGLPKSNGDAQNSTGYSNGNLPAGVDISEDGHYAIFGDANLTASVVEVSNISSGKLTPTVVYNIGTGVNSNNVWLSPDTSLLYVSNNASGQVSAGFFNPTNGTFGASCTSNVLTGFSTTWFATGALATELNTGLGGVLYVAEDGRGSPSSIGEIIPQKGTYSKGVSTCTLTEIMQSPASDPNSTALLSIGVYPPRLY